MNWDGAEEQSDVQMISLDRNRFVQLVIRFYQSSKLLIAVRSGNKADEKG